MTSKTKIVFVLTLIGRHIQYRGGISGEGGRGKGIGKEHIKYSGMLYTYSNEKTHDIKRKIKKQVFHLFSGETLVKLISIVILFF